MSEQEQPIKRMKDVLRERQFAFEPEPLSKFEGQELILRSFNMEVSTYGTGGYYAIMDCVDADGVGHLLTTGGQQVIRALGELGEADALPLHVRFVKVPSGNGRKVWNIE